MFTDFVINGEGQGPVAEGLQEVRFDPGLLRPFVAPDKRGSMRRFCIVNAGRRYNNVTGKYERVRKKVAVDDLIAKGVWSPVFNATSMRKEDWINLDRQVVMATRQRLRAWNDLESASSLGGFDGMSKMTHEYEAMSDTGEALVDMDALTDGRQDSPLYKLRSVPLPVTHADAWLSQRRISVSRNSGTPADITQIEMAGRRVGEMVEKTLVGVETGVTYGSQTTGITQHDGASKQWGYTNFTYRVTKTNLATPDGTNPQAVMADVIAMRETMYSNGFFGPFILYNSSGYDQWLDNDYFRAGSTAVQRTLRERLTGIDGISEVRRLDYLTSGYQLILIQMTPEVVQAINGMDVTVVQWPSNGGLRQNFKIMCIKVAVLKAPFNGVSGIIHGTTS